jgi:hypothetical protein
MVAVGIDPNIALGSILLFIPATLSAVAAVLAAKASRATRKEVQSPNGTTTGNAVAETNARLVLVEQNQADHARLDDRRFAQLGVTD